MVNGIKIFDKLEKIYLISEVYTGLIGYILESANNKVYIVSLCDTIYIVIFDL